MRAASLSWSKYFHIWLGTEALVSSYHSSHDAGSERMTTSVLTFAMMLGAMLADLRAEEDEEYGSDVAVKGFDRTIGEWFGPKKSRDILRIKPGS